ncbi:MAG: serine O-acetyltransferase [Halobacteriales archaeon]|jgi:serine O-acetyltransferase
MLSILREDAQAILDRDPAAKNLIEVVTAYPGLHAVWAHRINTWLWERNDQLIARLLSQFVRFMTGVEIHPGADVGRRVTIDHGMGVVIGETAEIGDDVHMYHGVTLGGNVPEPVKRHPTIGDDVVIGANATILGAIEIGDGANVGAGAVVTEEVPPGATAIGVPAEIVRHPEAEGDETVVEQGPDAESKTDVADSAGDGEGNPTDEPATRIDGEQSALANGGPRGEADGSVDLEPDAEERSADSEPTDN